MDFMYFYLPVALTSINIFYPIGLGLAVGILSGLFGVGGGFLMTPLLIMLGIPSTVAAATDSNQIVAASTSGTYAHYKIGNVDFKMGFHLLIGGFAGGLLGVQAINILRAMGNADFVIKMTYVLMRGQNYSIKLNWPYQAAPGEYLVTVYAVKDKKVVEKAEARMIVEQAGIVKTLANMAKNNGAVYGIISILAALAAGFGVGMVFRKGGGGH